MSYSIFYRSLFVKTRENKFIPIIESGSNNCYDAGNRRRARSWYNCTPLLKKGILLTAEEIMEGVEEWIDSVKERYAGKEVSPYEDSITTEHYTEKDIEQRFGYFDALAIYGKSTRETTAQQLRNFFKKGIENAVSIDAISLDVHWQSGETWKDITHRHTSNEEELMDALNDAKQSGNMVHVGFASEYQAELILDELAAKAKMQRKPRKKSTKGFVVSIEGAYLTKITARRFFRNWNLYDAHIYASNSAAQRVQQRILRSGYESEVVEVAKNDKGQWELVA